MKRPQSPPEFGEILSRRGGDVATLFSSEAYQSFVRDAQASYRHWDKIRRIAKDAGLDPELAWLLVKFARLPGARVVPLVATKDSRLTYTIPDHVQHEMMLIDQHLAGRIAVDPGLQLGVEKDRLIATAFMDEAIASSMLEGATTTVRVAEEMLRTGRKPRTTGERMVTNNYQAIQFIRENLKRPLSSDLLLELQSILTTNTLDRPNECGRYRKAGEEITVVDRRDGELMHEPPPADELPDRIKRLCEFANEPAFAQRGTFVHPFIRAALLHFQIGFDHPFCDGNGRTARAIFYWSMLRSGYWLFECLPISRLIYKSPSLYGQAFLYTETDGFDATYFLVYHARIVRQAREELRLQVGRTQREISEARELFRRERGLNHRQHELLMHAIQHPDAVYTIEGHQRSQGIAYATARADLLSLEERGYLSMSRSGTRMEFVGAKKIEAARKRRS